jgi:hypothetical protein
MKHYLIALILCIGPLFVHGQEPVFKEQKFKLIGMKQLDDQGILFIKKGEQSSEVILQFIDRDLKTKWTTPFAMGKLRGYSFHKVQVKSFDQKLYWVNQQDQHASLSIFNLQNGQLLKDSIILVKGLEVESPMVHCEATADGLLVISHDYNQLTIKRYGMNGWINEEIIGPLLEATQLHSFESHFVQNEALFASSYEVNKNHRKLNIKLYKVTLNTQDTQYFERELKLDHMSYTYNSTIDPNLFSVIQLSDGFMLMGKLDHAFAGPYPKTKLTEAFVGVWMAKFNFNLEQEFFSEIPFQYFHGMVTNDVVSKAAVLSIHEDLNQSLILNIHEVRELFYGKKYAIPLDKKGKHHGIVGGRDAYHFFEYDTKGLHGTAKSSHLRLMNDDWTYYSSSSLHMLPYIDQLHSSAILAIKTRSEDHYMDLSDQIYTTIKLNGKPLMLEYLDRRGGQLSIYRL